MIMIITLNLKIVSISMQPTSLHIPDNFISPLKSHVPDIFLTLVQPEMASRKRRSKIIPKGSPCVRVCGSKWPIMIKRYQVGHIIIYFRNDASSLIIRMDKQGKLLNILSGIDVIQTPKHYYHENFIGI